MPAEAPPRTMAGVYSRALDEQDRLIRQMSRPEIMKTLDQVDPGMLSARSLISGEVGYVSKPVCQVLEATAQDIPETTLWPELLLAPAAFLVLADPVILPSRASVGDGRFTIRAFSWVGRGTDEIALVAWADAHRNTHPMTPTVPMVVGVWPFGRTWAQAAAQYFDPETSDQLTELGNEEDARMDLPALKWLAALNAFCQQRLVTSTRAAPERATRRRIERAGRSPSDVLVVELRRADVRRGEPTGDAREWSCSWIVRGFWRQQWYESKQTHQAIYIAPYVKGPADKPLKIRKRVFAIVH